jgi:tripartite-type tricarboxylate transporter receptor subunit TctC
MLRACTDARRAPRAPRTTRAAIARTARLCLALLGAAALATLAAALPAAALAQGRAPIRIVTPAPAGAGMDSTARLVALYLGERLGEPVVVENKPGAATAIGTEHVVRSAPDGRTLVIAAAALAINPSLYKLNYDLFADLRPVIHLSNEHYLLVARNDLGAVSPADLPKLAREKPGGLNCAAGPGVGTIACEQLRLQLGGNVTSVLYPGMAPAVTALLGSHVDLMFVPIVDVIGFVRAGKVRAIANASDSKAASPFPELPLLADLWPGFAITGLYGVLAPAGTPPETIAMLNREINAVLQSAPVREYLANGWQVPVGGTPERFGETLRKVHDHYQRVIRAAGISVK